MPMASPPTATRPSPDPFTFPLNAQADIIREAGFPDVMAKAIVANGGSVVEGDDLSVSSLGFTIEPDEDQADAASSGGLGDDFQSVWGPDQYWPWWSWILFPLGVLVCCPVAYFIYRHRTGPSGPPSPSGPAGGPGMFGSKAGGSQGGKEYDPNMSAADYNMKEYEKNAGAGYLDGGESGSVAATAVSVSKELKSHISWCDGG